MYVERAVLLKPHVNDSLIRHSSLLYYFFFVKTNDTKRKLHVKFVAYVTRFVFFSENLKKNCI